MIFPAFFALVKPVSTIAKPHCIKNTNTAPKRYQTLISILFTPNFFCRSFLLFQENAFSLAKCFYFINFYKIKNGRQNNYVSAPLLFMHLFLHFLTSFDLTFLVLWVKFYYIVTVKFYDNK